MLRIMRSKPITDVPINGILYNDMVVLPINILTKQISIFKFKLFI